MSIFNVSIYIETTIKGPRAGMAAGAWLVEYITGKEVPETRSGFLWREETTENALTLELLAAACQQRLGGSGRRRSGRER